MQGYESTLFNTLGGSQSEIMMKVQSVLGLGTSEEVVPWQPQKNLSSSDCMKLCSVIGTYWLVDIVAMLSGAESVPSVEQ